MLQYFVPIPNNALLHPTAFAGWVGLFVTALNLLPAGQLDGGHVARAVLGDNAKFVSWGFLGFMFLLGLFYPGWFIIGVFILLLGARHPPPLNDLVRIDAKRYGIAAAATAVMLLSFVAVPVFEIPAEAGVQFEAVAAPDVGVTNLTATVANQSTTTVAFVVRNVGNVRTNVSLSLDLDNFARGNLNVTFTGVTVGNATANVTATGSWFYLDTNGTANVTLLLDATRYPLAPGPWIFHVNTHGDPDGLPEFDRSLRIDLTVAP